MRQGNAWMLISALSPAPLYSVSFASLNYGAGKINAMLLLLLWNTEKFKSARLREAMKKEVDARIGIATHDTVEQKWEKLKDVVIQAAENCVGYEKQRAANKPWISNEMIVKML